MADILFQQHLEMMGKKYVAYLKQVPTKLGYKGAVEATTIRAFIREIK